MNIEMKNRCEMVDWDRMKGAVLRDTTNGELFTIRQPNSSDSAQSGPPADLLVPYTKT